LRTIWCNSDANGNTHGDCYCHSNSHFDGNCYCDNHAFTHFHTQTYPCAKSSSHTGAAAVMSWLEKQNKGRQIGWE
jgi:hypothetical protein